LGFPPAKRKRKKFFEKVVSSEYPVIFYESPHRLLKTLKELAERNQELKVVICKELTKKFEKIYRGKIKKVIKEIQQDSIKGEYVIVLKQA
jgi:16S rRNA (cytidine1402-2'-O)-methyltransferase